MRINQLTTQAAGVSCAMLLITAAGCTAPQATGPDCESVLVMPAKGDTAARTLAAQDQIAKAFYRSIVPNLETCWGRSGGKGAVWFAYTYKRAGDQWAIQDVQTHSTSLERRETEAAFRCMSESSAGTTFGIEALDASDDADEMVIYWGWPVPLPGDRSQLARMITSIDDTRCFCHDCNFDAKCIRSCSGWDIGCKETSNGCQMYGRKCKTGWSGSLTGAVIQ